ncbi:MAG: cupin domain-containing protein [Chloroflexi bacterium]|nr:cupin domain-containing protein [Chloroflexota bacterium]
MTTVMTEQERSDRRDALTEELRKVYLGGLWQPRKRLESLSAFKWAWADIWGCLREAGEIVEVDEQSPMRTLQLINPALEELKATSRTLQVSVQLLKPGELAKAHRHTQPQPRFIVEAAEGAYTTVDGEQLYMHTGDFIITPGWSWHDHTNGSGHQAVWLDIHDPHLAGYVGAMFNERYGEDSVQPIEKQDGYHLQRASLYRSQGLVGQSGSIPMRYRWSDAVEVLEEMDRAGESDAHDGVLLEYRSPLDGGPATPTIGARVQKIRPGEETRLHRHTETVVYHVVEGEGELVMGAGGGGGVLKWEERDCFMVTPWEWHGFRNESSRAAYLFSVTDAPAVRALGFYREEIAR